MKLSILGIILLAGMTSQAFAAKCNCETGEGLAFPQCREKCSGASAQPDMPDDTTGSSTSSDEVLSQ